MLVELARQSDKLGFRYTEALGNHLLGDVTVAVQNTRRVLALDVVESKEEPCFECARAVSMPQVRMT